MPWIYLLIAGVSEVAWAIGMKLSDGFSKPWWTAFTVVLMLISFGFLIAAVRSLPIGTAYAIWTGIGAAGTAILGMMLFHEPVNPARLLFLGLIVAGVIGLKATATE